MEAMEESDHEMSEDGDSDPETWAGLLPGPGERMEQCKLAGKTLRLPELLLEKKQVFTSVLSMDTWNTALTDDQRKRLENLLPDFGTDQEDEKQESLRMLFNWENFKFGNPLQDLQKKLKEGYLHPDIARYRKQTRQFRYRDYKMRQQRHLSDLLKRLILSRQELFEQAISLAPGEPIKFQYLPPSKKKMSPMEQVVKKKSIRILKEVREECGVPDTSSDEEEESTNPVQRSKRQLFKSLGPIPSPEPTIPSVLATYASKPIPQQQPTPSTSSAMVNGESKVASANSQDKAGGPAWKRPRPISPVEVTEETFKQMIRLHKKKKMFEADLPELDTASVMLQDILTRCRANKKNLKGAAGSDLTQANSAAMKKRMKLKSKGEKKRAMKSKVLPTPAVTSNGDDATLPQLQSPGLDSSSNILDGLSLNDLFFFSPTKTVFGPIANFYSLLRDIIREFPDGHATVSSIEQRVSDWLEHNDEISNPWMALSPNWMEQVASALNCLSGSDPSTQLLTQPFTPLVECQSSNSNNQMSYKWVGSSSQESDAELGLLFRNWLQVKESAALPPTSSVADIIAEITGSGSPPPSKAKTNFIVRPTSTDEKALFREQERLRFASPHRAFTYMMHGYDSVVGPVKGVYDKDTSTNKAREHNLLVSERPPFVTILTLVRDAAARLPNGEGTRGDICELLKDSQFLAPGVTDTQINGVVSGALDRLHSEKDPCVKYDVTRKLWIYLHRNRTQDEFERIHQAQAATAKVKKTVAKPKTPKAPPQSKDVVNTPPTLASSPLHQTSFSLSNLSTDGLKSNTSPSIPSLEQPLSNPSPLLPPATTAASQTQDSASLITKAGKSVKQSRTPVTPSVGVGAFPLPSSASLTSNLTPTIAQLKAAQAASTSLTSNLTPTIAQLKAAQAAMAKASAAAAAASISQANSANATASVAQTIAKSAANIQQSAVTHSTNTSHVSQNSSHKQLTAKQLTAAAKRSASIAGTLSSGNILSSPSPVTSSPLLTVTPLGLSMTTTPSPSSSSLLSSSLLQSTGNLSTSLAPQLCSAGPMPSVVATPSLTAVGSRQGKTGVISSSASSPSASPLPASRSAATTFSLVTTLNTSSATTGNAAVNPGTPSARPPTISMLQGQQMIKQQQLLLKQKQQAKLQQQKQLQLQKQLQKHPQLTASQLTASQSILRQNAALMAAVGGQTVTNALKISDTIGGSSNLGHKKAGNKPTMVSVSQAAASMLKSQTFTMAAKPGIPTPSITLPKNAVSIASNVKQTSLILSQDGLAGGVASPHGGKLVALTSVPGQAVGEGTVMAQIMQPAGVARGQPIRLQGGNIMQPIQISGKPLGSTKGLVQLAGRSGQPLGLIRTPQGINLIPHQNTTGGKTATVVAVGSSSASVVQSSRLSAPVPTAASGISTSVTNAARQQQQLAALAAVQGGKSGGSSVGGQAKIIGQTPGGLLVTQLAPGNIALRAGSGQAKLLQSGQASLVPTQFILQHAPGSVTSQAPIIVTSNAAGMKGTQNLQMVRTVLSQPAGNLKPGQATILISQPTPTTQVLQAAGGKMSNNRSSPKTTKGQPVYARIITPPPGLKLAGGSTTAGTVTASVTGTTTPTVANMNMIQTAGGKLSLSGLPVVSLAMVNPGTIVPQSVQAGKLINKTEASSSAASGNT